MSWSAFVFLNYEVLGEGLIWRILNETRLLNNGAGEIYILD